MICLICTMALVVLLGIVSIAILAIDNRVNKITNFFISNTGIAAIVVSCVIIFSTCSLINAIHKLDFDLQNQGSYQLNLNRRHN